jgi:hypothetical protein
MRRWWALVAAVVLATTPALAAGQAPPEERRALVVGRSTALLQVGGGEAQEVLQHPLEARAALEQLLGGDQQTRREVLQRGLSRAVPPGQDGDPEESATTAPQSDDGDQGYAYPPFLVPAGDLDADGRADVLSTALSRDFDTLTASGRRGFDGRPSGRETSTTPRLQAWSP